MASTPILDDSKLSGRHRILVRPSRSLNSSFQERKIHFSLICADIEKQIADEAIFVDLLQVYNMSLAS